MSVKSIGILIGFIVGLLLSVVIFIICNKNHKSKTEYDERQKIIRGNAYKYGFFTAMVYFGMQVLFDAIELELPLEYSVSAFLGLVISALVTVIYSILKDAYWGENNNQKRYFIFFAVITAINLLVAIMNIVDGEMVVDGIVQFCSVNLICAIMLIILMVVALFKDKLSSGEEDE